MHRILNAGFDISVESDRVKKVAFEIKTAGSNIIEYLGGEYSKNPRNRIPSTAHSAIYSSSKDTFFFLLMR